MTETQRTPAQPVAPHQLTPRANRSTVAPAAVLELRRALAGAQLRNAADALDAGRALAAGPAVALLREAAVLLAGEASP